MLQSNLEKEPTKAEMAKKLEAWKTINSVLVRANSEFMKSLNSILADKKEQHLALQTKLEKGEGTEDDNAEYIFIGGYIQCLEDILHAKRKEEV
jgi:hypothetical protein